MVIDQYAVWGRRTRQCAPLLRIALLAAAALVPAAAHADEIDNVRSLTLAVSGRVSEYCALGDIADMHFGDITRPNLRAATRVPLNCNVPFDMTIKAARGGLTHEALPTGQGPYSGTLPYTIDIAMPVRKPQRALVGRSFESRDLLGGRTISSEGGIAIDGMALTVALGRPSGEAGLLAGKYGETIEITIAPR